MSEVLLRRLEDKLDKQAETLTEIRESLARGEQKMGDLQRDIDAAPTDRAKDIAVHESRCEAKKDITEIKNLLATTKGVAIGIRWTVGKAIALVAFILTSGAGLFAVVELIVKAATKH